MIKTDSFHAVSGKSLQIGYVFGFGPAHERVASKEIHLLSHYLALNLSFVFSGADQVSAEVSARLETYNNER